MKKRNSRGRGGRTPSAESERAGFDSNPLAHPSDRDAFLRDPEEGPATTGDDLAEELAERYLSSATSGEDASEVIAEEDLEEEGGPYVTTAASEELGDGPDASNPSGTEPAPFPTTQSES